MWFSFAYLELRFCYRVVLLTILLELSRERFGSLKKSTYPVNFLNVKGKLKSVPFSVVWIHSPNNKKKKSINFTCLILLFCAMYITCFKQNLCILRCHNDKYQYINYLFSHYFIFLDLRYWVRTNSTSFNHSKLAILTLIMFIVIGTTKERTHLASGRWCLITPNHRGFKISRFRHTRESQDSLSGNRDITAEIFCKRRTKRDKCFWRKNTKETRQGNSMSAVQ